MTNGFEELQAALGNGEAIMRKTIIEAAQIYINYLTEKKLGIVMPEFSLQQAKELVAIIDRAVDSTVKDPRAKELIQLFKKPEIQPS